MSKDNELREDVKRYLVRKGKEYRDKTGRYSRIAVPMNRGLVDDLTALIKQHTDRARWQEVRAMLNIPEPSRTKLLRDRLNQLKIANDISPEARRKLKQYADKVKESE